MTQVKLETLRRLARRRQACRYDGYAAIGDFHGGAYECDHVSPYTKGAGNVDSTVFVLLQDWLSKDAISRRLNPAIRDLGRNPALRTNRTLERYLDRHFSLALADVYATNLFPFIKPGGMSAPVHRSALRLAARDFGIPQIDAVRPRVVIAMGLEVYNAVAFALDRDEALTLDDAIRTPLLHKGSRIWCQAHTGYWGQRNRRQTDPARPDADWARMVGWYESGCETGTGAV